MLYTTYPIIGKGFIEDEIEYYENEIARLRSQPSTPINEQIIQNYQERIRNYRSTQEASRRLIAERATPTLDEESIDFLAQEEEREELLRDFLSDYVPPPKKKKYNKYSRTTTTPPSPLPSPPPSPPQETKEETEAQEEKSAEDKSAESKGSGMYNGMATVYYLL